MGRHECHPLAEVDGRAATEGDDRIATSVRIAVERFVDGLFSRVFRGLVEECHLDFRRQDIESALYQSEFHKPRIGNQQGPAHIEQLQFLPKQLQRPKIKLDSRQVLHQRHRLSPSSDSWHPILGIRFLRNSLTQPSASTQSRVDQAQSEALEQIHVADRSPRSDRLFTSASASLGAKKLRLFPNLPPASAV